MKWWALNILFILHQNSMEDIYIYCIYIYIFFKGECGGGGLIVWVSIKFVLALMAYVDGFTLWE